MDLRHLPNLRIFAIHTNIESDARDAQGLLVLHDINSILSTIPKANQVTQLSFKFCFTVFDLHHPFGKYLEQDWVGLCDEVIRISAGKPLELYLVMTFYSPGHSPPPENKLYYRIIALLSDHPNICTRFGIHQNPYLNYEVLRI